MRWWAKALSGGLDAAIALLDALGARGVRWEWKKRTWKQALEDRLARWENLERGVRVRMKMCRACRALVEGRPSRCPSCGASLRGIEGGGVGRLLGLLLPSLGGGSLTMVLVSANVAMSLLVLLLWGSGEWSGSLFGLLAPSREALFLLGAKYAPAIRAGEVWRLVTANYLHGGIIHLVFNSIALLNLGPLIESAFGWRKLFLIYTTAGVAAFAVSTVVRPGALSIGASGAIFGLLGFAVVFGRYRAGPSARALSDHLMRWLMFGLFMFFVPGIDSAAHVGGLIPGAALGLFLEPGEPRSRAGEAMLWLVTGIALLATFGSFALMALAYPANLARLGGS
jgi:rhomboid protease GluP